MYIVYSIYIGLYIVYIIYIGLYTCIYMPVSFRHLCVSASGFFDSVYVFFFSHLPEL